MSYNWIIFSAAKRRAADDEIRQELFRNGQTNINPKVNKNNIFACERIGDIPTPKRVKLQSGKWKTTQPSPAPPTVEVIDGVEILEGPRAKNVSLF